MAPGISGGALYLNTGFWLNEPCCVAFDRGTIWFGPVQTFAGGGQRQYPWLPNLGGDLSSSPRVHTSLYILDSAKAG
jgi:hypothetical protein